jgi:ectoine hydroxylase-related dioxygenase (phytanoyl-CoA dioxygenase family)
MTVTLTPEEIARFHEDGFLSLREITTAAEVAWLRDVYDRLFSQRAGWERGDFFDFAGTDGADGPATLPQLLDPSRHEPALKATIFRANAQALARQLLGPSAELVFEHAMLKPARIGGETPWHQDEAFFPKYTNYQSVTFWMPLQPVDTANGCLEFIPRSHKGALLAHRSIGNDPRIHGLEAEGADGTRRVACPLPEGGATVHHYRTLHHAGPNLTAAPRRAYALGFGVRSRRFVQRSEFPWNVEKATAREQRAWASQTAFQRRVAQLKAGARDLLY